MKKIFLYLMSAILLGSGCQKEEIVEPELFRPQAPETVFGDFVLEVTNITDHSAVVNWATPSEKGRYDVYVNNVLVSTGEVSYRQAWHDLANLSPEETYQVKVRWICSDDEVKFAETSFTTKASFLSAYWCPLEIGKYSYADYSCLAMNQMDDSKVYTLRTQRDFGYQNVWVTLMKTGADEKTLWTMDYPLYVGEDFTEYRKTEVLPDGSVLLLTTKRIVCTEANGQTRWIYEFFKPEEKKIFLNDVCMMDDGNMMLVGSSQRKWGQEDGAWEEAYVVVVSPEGKILKEVYYDILKHNRLDRIEPMANGNFLVCGVAIDESYTFSHGDFCVYTIDASANILNVQRYPDFYYRSVKSSLKDEEGCFYFLGKETKPSVYIDSRISIIRLAPDGTLVSHNHYDRRVGEGELEPVYMGLKGENLIVVADDVKGTNVLVTDKQGNRKSHWGLVTFPYEDTFVYADCEDTSMICLDKYGYYHSYDLSGYIEYPYASLMDNE